MKNQRKLLENERDQLYVSILGRCPPYEESRKINGERKGPTLGVQFRDVSALWRVKENDWRTKVTKSNHKSSCSPAKTHRAVYTRENKPRLTLAAAYIRGERNHLYEFGLHKTRTAGVNGSLLSPRPDQSNDDVVLFWCERASQKAKRLPLVRKIAIFYTVVFFSN